MRPTPGRPQATRAARRIQAELERARHEIMPATGQLTGTVTVGLLASTAELLADELVRDLRDRHPGIILRLTPGYAGDLRGWLGGRGPRLALLYGLRPSPAIQVTSLIDENLWAVAAVEDGLTPDSPVPFAAVARRRPRPALSGGPGCRRRSARTDHHRRDQRGGRAEAARAGRSRLDHPAAGGHRRRPRPRRMSAAPSPAAPGHPPGGWPIGPRPAPARPATGRRADQACGAKTSTTCSWPAPRSSSRRSGGPPASDLGRRPSRRCATSPPSRAAPPTAGSSRPTSSSTAP
jgi:hypothetical protein